MLTIATWNINSVRLRAGLVVRFLKQARPDILCLQEIKCPEELFPREPFVELGYPHISISGQPGYHGVATVSRLPLGPLPRESFCGTAEARHLGCAVQLPGGGTFALHNIYVPPAAISRTPRKIPSSSKSSPTSNRWRHGALTRTAATPYCLAISMWRPRNRRLVPQAALEGREPHARGGGGADECAKPGRLVRPCRGIIPPERKLYTWWSYRARDWLASDRGRRGGHLGQCLARRVMAECTVLKEVRGWEGPSDHVPVIVELDL